MTLARGGRGSSGLCEDPLLWGKAVRRWKVLGLSDVKGRNQDKGWQRRGEKALPLAFVTPCLPRSERPRAGHFLS